ncbi:hypothetical protein BC939DRAFT_281024 [Gamsiella multidivaricata]|uniref:uncharacterized protein n=1 Tax=Gamsiella multidivaricata TaxID=101098 RepID=UPI0022208999|nr:uncharacterized protein BC939DRAFT_281024 [Gamsiella multidivaricata]KAG0371142.1 Apoptotic chromatin condensation inducer in the nucleus [Gamsiella multidivaricata]KAI7830409.1 hypothetical protein BC939DRAFT_281024 [Gamsiella multidivaricata]
MIDPNSLKVTELKAELTTRGLSTKGLKKELVARLEEALAAERTTPAPAESVTEPDVAPKEVETNQGDNSTDMDTNAPSKSPTTTASEVQEITQIVKPVTEPKTDADEAVVNTPLPPVPAVAEEKGEQQDELMEGSMILEPVVGTPTLTQEGLVDTTTTSATGNTIVAASTESKKRSLDTADASSQQGLATGNASQPKEIPAKRLKAIEIKRDQFEAMAAAAKDAVEAAARRRSMAPSPSPAPGRPILTTTTTTSSTATVAEDNSSQSSTPSAPRSPTEDRKGGRRFDARSMMEKQIKLAAKDRQPEVSSKNSGPSQSAPSPPSASIEALKEISEEPGATLPSETTRALAITNFLRPLTVNQVKRMLSEFGEIEVLWMDSIRTHCYVIYKEAASAEKAYSQVKGQVFPKETGKPLEPHFIAPEAAAASIDAAEKAQKSGNRPVIYTGQGEPAAVSKPAVAPHLDDVEVVVFKREKVEQKQETQVVQPTELFKMTKAQPALYYKPVKEPPTATTDASESLSEATLLSVPMAATGAN